MATTLDDLEFNTKQVMETAKQLFLNLLNSIISNPQRWVIVVGISVATIFGFTFFGSQCLGYIWSGQDRVSLDSQDKQPANYKSDKDWNTCIFNCALQWKPKKSGVCVADCDAKY